MGFKAHVHDIQNHPNLRAEVRQLIGQITETGMTCPQEMDIIRHEWERLGRPLCKCGCNRELN